MPGYEDAVATKLLASHCVMCSRPLVDAISVETGIGPICREKYGYDDIADRAPGDDVALMRAVEVAPEPLRRAVEGAARKGKYQQVANTAVWHAAMAVSYGGPVSNQVIAVAQALCRASGFERLSERIKTFHMRSTIRMMRVSGNMVCAQTPYNDAFVAAVRAIPGRHWDGTKNCVPVDKLQHLVAALSAAFPGQMMEDFEGNVVVIPRDVQFPPPPTKPAGAPTEVTDETGIADQLKELKRGDVVIVDGKERQIGWIDHTKGRLGLVQRGQRGYEFMAITEVSLMPEKKVAAEEKKRVTEQAEQASRQEAPVPVPRPSDRPIPETAFPYQVEGVGWLDQKGSGILGDEPGLGKTLQACVATDPPCLVVCPAAMRVEWVREMNRWRPDLTVQVITGRKALKPSDYASTDVVVINYDIIGSHLKPLLQTKIKTLIADEAHYLKTLKLSRNKYAGSTRAKAFVELSDKAERVFLLTATPIMNRPIELWPLLHMVDPQRWDSYSDFGKRYCDGKLEARRVRGGGTQMVWDFTGHSNERELNAILTSQYMLRRTKDILDLPEKSRQSKLVTLDPAVAKEYDAAAKEFLRWVEAQGGPEAVEKAMQAQALVKMTTLRHLCAVGKLNYAVEWIKNHFEATRRPLVVMAHHRDVTLGIVERLRTDEKGEPVLVEDASGRMRALTVGKIIGGMGEAQRTADKDAFQRGELDVIVCSIQAAGVGLTLTAASETLFVERAWRPADLVQAEDRIYRIGQKNKCTITYLDAAGTIDEAIATLLVSKRSTFARVIDGVDVDDDEAARLVLGVLFGLGGEKGVKMPARSLTGGKRAQRAQQNPSASDDYEPLIPWMNAAEL